MEVHRPKGPVERTGRKDLPTGPVEKFRPKLLIGKTDRKARRKGVSHANSSIKKKEIFLCCAKIEPYLMELPFVFKILQSRSAALLYLTVACGTRPARAITTRHLVLLVFVHIMKPLTIGYSVPSAGETESHSAETDQLFPPRIMMSFIYTIYKILDDVDDLDNLNNSHHLYNLFNQYHPHHLHPRLLIVRGCAGSVHQ